NGPSNQYELSSIRLIGTVGEAVNREAWAWARKHIGRHTPEGVPMVDTSGQSETGATMVSPRQIDSTCKPGWVSRPLPGSYVAVVDDDGLPTAPSEQGVIVVARPGPGASRTVWGDAKRFYNSYWQDFYWAENGRGWFLAGDGAKTDDDGDIW